MKIVRFGLVLGILALLGPLSATRAMAAPPPWAGGPGPHGLLGWRHPGPPQRPYRYVVMAPPPPPAIYYAPPAVVYGLPPVFVSPPVLSFVVTLPLH